MEPWILRVFRKTLPKKGHRTGIRTESIKVLMRNPNVLFWQAPNPFHRQRVARLSHTPTSRPLRMRLPRTVPLECLHDGDHRWSQDYQDRRRQEANGQGQGQPCGDFTRFLLQRK